ncbi:hypothetical protein [Fodinibius halophilus]|uniref:Uncharacterized protein n=1 Tax=Fodinibius halophilus TaxID=1736908 RepID=A0A6M1TCR7_9BACT|nr:hypothetical protein [Fodinibius halophilus]NGP87972.1 hypothetical protein [Fodinibius halophilus]
MDHFRTKYQHLVTSLSVTLLILLSFHAISIHGVVDNLVYCFEENGEVNIESEVGSLFSIPSEDVMHEKQSHDHQTPTLEEAEKAHNDLALSLACSKEQQITQFNQERTLKFLNGILYSKVENLPQSQVFQLVSYTSPLIEDSITASLKTVVRILYN